MSPINSDLSDLPQGDKPEGRPPDENPDIVGRLAEAFYAKYTADGHDTLAMAVEGARWRASWSDMCSRRVGYEIRHASDELLLAEMMAEIGENTVVPPDLTDSIRAQAQVVEESAQTDPPALAEFWRFNLGTFVHEAMQALAGDAFPGAEAEVNVAIDDFGAAHVDLVIDDPDPEAVYPRTVVEIKSDGGFHFKISTTNWKGMPEGPRSSAVVQGAVSAEALNADRLIVAVFALELLSPDMAAKAGRDELGRFAAQWTFLPDEFLPIAEKERKRVRRMIEIVDEGGLVPRHVPSEMPPRARITDPARSGWTVQDDSGAIVLAGQVWNGQYCSGYCPHFSRCLSDGPS